MCKCRIIKPKEEADILEALEGGLPVRDVAKRFDRSHSSISRVASRNNLNLDRSRSKKATDAAKAFNRIRRLETSNRSFRKYEELLARCDNANDLRNLAIAYGIFVDKRLLEDADDGGQRGGEIHLLLSTIKRGGGGR